MAKKAKKEPVKPEEPKTTLAAAKSVVVKAADAVAKAVTKAAETVKEHIVEPVVEAVQKPKKPKRVRYVREKKEKAPKASAPALPKPSKKVASKLMTKGLVAPPKDDRKGAQKPKK